MAAMIVTIPHSGEQIPPEAGWLVNLEPTLLLSDVDRFVDRLYEPVLTRLRIRTVETVWHRYAVDLNRWSEDVDADSVAGHPNPRGTFPHGLHWVRTMDGRVLMPTAISPDQHQALVNRCFHPFHREVRTHFDALRALGAGAVFHLDLHSMPSVGTAGHRDPGQRRADVVISDFNGRSCDARWRDLVLQSFERQGLKTAYNWPYVGGRLTQTYGRPELEQHSIQVELNRALYMDEQTKQPLNQGWSDLVRRLSAAIEEIHGRLS
jgi:N-formylglutamate amidohydrolase